MYIYMSLSLSLSLSIYIYRVVTAAKAPGIPSRCAPDLAGK